MSTCKFCDGEPGSLATYAGQVALPINGRVQGIDECIHRIVAALNAGNVRTTASCCGHGKMPGCILLEDGRVLAIYSSPEDARMYDNLESRSHSHSTEDRSVWQPPRLDGTR